jgi:glutamyl-tRNA reductase
MEQIFLVGTSHHLAPVAWRERVAITRADIPTALHALSTHLPEAAILSTCNRLELYAVVENGATARETIANFLAETRAVSAAEMQTYFYEHAEEAAARHLFTVAAGLDSMLVGEAQILGQVNKARQMAQEAQTLGAVLSRLFQAAITTGKAARTRTAIGRGALSLGYAAVELARAIFGTGTPRYVLVIGAGEMAENAARCLAANGSGPILVANRTFERASALVRKFGGRAIHFGSIPDALSEVDIVIASSAAPHLVIHYEDVVRAMSARGKRPLFLIDIAVPRDIDPRAAEVEGVRLYNIDDLRGVCDTNLARRQREADKVRAIVEAETRKFMDWLAARSSTFAISALYQKAEALRQLELKRARRYLGALSPEQRDAIDALTRSLVSKILHEPVLHLKQPGNGWVRTDYLEIARALFGLTVPDRQPYEDTELATILSARPGPPPWGRQ